MCEKTNEGKTRLRQIKQRPVDDTNKELKVLRSVDRINIAWDYFQLQSSVDARK